MFVCIELPIELSIVLPIVLPIELPIVVLFGPGPLGSWARAQWARAQVTFIWDPSTGPRGALQKHVFQTKNLIYIS